MVFRHICLFTIFVILCAARAQTEHNIFTCTGEESSRWSNQTCWSLGHRPTRDEVAIIGEANDSIVRLSIDMDIMARAIIFVSADTQVSCNVNFDSGSIEVGAIAFDSSLDPVTNSVTFVQNPGSTKQCLIQIGTSSELEANNLRINGSYRLATPAALSPSSNGPPSFTATLPAGQYMSITDGFFVDFGAIPVTLCGTAAGAGGLYASAATIVDFTLAPDAWMVVSDAKDEREKVLTNDVAAASNSRVRHGHRSTVDTNVYLAIGGTSNVLSELHVGADLHAEARFRTRSASPPSPSSSPSSASLFATPVDMSVSENTQVRINKLSLNNVTLQVGSSTSLDLDTLLLNASTTTFGASTTVSVREETIIETSTIHGTASTVISFSSTNTSVTVPTVFFYRDGARFTGEGRLNITTSVRFVEQVHANLFMDKWSLILSSTSDVEGRVVTVSSADDLGVFISSSEPVRVKDDPAFRLYQYHLRTGAVSAGDDVANLEELTVRSVASFDSTDFIESATVHLTISSLTIPEKSRVLMEIALSLTASSRVLLAQSAALIVPSDVQGLTVRARAEGGGEVQPELTIELHQKAYLFAEACDFGDVNVKFSSLQGVLVCPTAILDHPRGIDIAQGGYLYAGGLTTSTAVTEGTTVPITLQSRATFEFLKQAGPFDVTVTNPLGAGVLALAGDIHPTHRCNIDVKDGNGGALLLGGRGASGSVKYMQSLVFNLPSWTIIMGDNGARFGREAETATTAANVNNGHLRDIASIAKAPASAPTTNQVFKRLLNSTVVAAVAAAAAATVQEGGGDEEIKFYFRAKTIRFSSSVTVQPRTTVTWQPVFSIDFESDAGLTVAEEGTLAVATDMICMLSSSSVVVNGSFVTHERGCTIDTKSSTLSGHGVITGKNGSSNASEGWSAYVVKNVGEVPKCTFAGNLSTYVVKRFEDNVLNVICTGISEGSSAPSSFVLDLDLPLFQGLSFNSTTGQISGRADLPIRAFQDVTGRLVPLTPLSHGVIWPFILRVRSKCEDAFYCPPNSTDLIPCPAMYFCFEALQPSPCPGGFHCPASTTHPLPCGKGRFCEPMSALPSLCPVGYATASEYSVRCPPCPLSTYTELRGQAECTPCPEGSSTALPGATSVKKCQFPPQDRSLSLSTILMIVAGGLVLILLLIIARRVYNNHTWSTYQGVQVAAIVKDTLHLDVGAVDTALQLGYLHFIDVLVLALVNHVAVERYYTSLEVPIEVSAAAAARGLNAVSSCSSVAVVLDMMPEEHYMYAYAIADAMREHGYFANSSCDRGPKKQQQKQAQREKDAPRQQQQHQQVLVDGYVEADELMENDGMSPTNDGEKAQMNENDDDDDGDVIVYNRTNFCCTSCLSLYAFPTQTIHTKLKEIHRTAKQYLVSRVSLISHSCATSPVASVAPVAPSVTPYVTRAVTTISGGADGGGITVVPGSPGSHMRLGALGSSSPSSPHGIVRSGSSILVPSLSFASSTSSSSSSSASASSSSSTSPHGDDEGPSDRLLG